MKVLEMNVMDMNELEIKSILHGLIQKARNKRKLLRYFDAFKDVETEEISDGWSDLPIEEQMKLDAAIAETYDTANLVSKEDAFKMMNKWLTE
jgi:hypothetical protein